ncbi:hypothetical protein ARMGADRAFT_1039689 [Armillaria gallica]|uniref:Uncharacterized protein n=1 Tax=Armillaria gallica TaxID=47427 RepID=A0A2H3CW47_ARMGA|nr:hypothetical protein ARMGADRAFT_1039689 [Armillaria gallica]
MEWLVHARATDKDTDSFNLDPRLLRHLVAEPVAEPDMPPQYHPREVNDHTPDVMTLSAGDSSYREHHDNDDDGENDHLSLFSRSLTFKPAFTQPHWTTQLSPSSKPPPSNHSNCNARKRWFWEKANLTAAYEKSDGSTQGNASKRKRNRSSHQVERNLLRARAKRHDRILSQGVEVLKSSRQTLDAKELPFNGTGWAGKPFNRAHGSTLKKAWHSSTLGPLLTGFYRVTFSKDIVQFVADNMAAFMEEARKFAAACTPFTNKDAGANVPALTAWHHIPQNADAVKKYFAKGTMLWHVTQVAASIVKYEFPGIFQRYRECSEYMQSRFGIEPMFGCFFNFCINMSRQGYFKDDEKCWLVLWEGKLLLQLPPGVFLAYPSSLFYHFNLDLNGSKHSSPLNNPWQEGEERGSCVWFSQATMFQTSELDIPTMKAGRATGMDVRCDYESLIDGGNFFWEQDEPEAE